MEQRSGRVDLATVNLDSVPTSNLRSEEELRRFTLDEGLESKPIDKALHLLTSGDDTQKISTINSLTDIYKFDAPGCMQKVIPKIQQYLATAAADFQLSYCASIKSLHDEKIIPIDNFSSVFLQTILTGIDHRDSQVVDAWVDCLVNLIPSLPMNILIKEIKPLAIAKASPAKPVHMRAESCRIIGALCKKLPGPEVDKELIPVIVPLWKDPSPDVRSTMIRQLPFVVRAIGTISETEYIIGPFVQLVSDELPKVAEVAFAAMVASIPYFSVDNLRQSIWPLLREIIVQAFKFDHNLLLVVAEQYGKMVTGLERAIPVSEKDIYVKHYMSLLEKASDKQTRMGRNRMAPELCASCRKHCAANYKEMAKFAYSDSNKILLDQLHIALEDLVVDHFWECRKTIASSMYEIIQIYGKYNFILKKSVHLLLNDSLVDVIDGLIPHLAEILVIFNRAGYYSKDQMEPQNSELLRSIEHCESTLLGGYNWRSYCGFISQMEIMWYIFTPDIVYNKFIDLFFRRLYTCRVLQSRLALLRAIVINLKFIPRAFYKAEAKNKLIDLSTSSNFYDRMLFIRLMDIFTDIHSTSFFKDHYYLRMIQMSEDVIPNIRWAICTVLPKLQAMIKIPDDKILQSIVDDAIMSLSNDKDKDIQDAVKKAKTEIDSGKFVAFPFESKNLEEERQLQNLTSKQIQSFPDSIISIFEPTVLGVSVLQRGEVDDQLAVDTSSLRRRSVGRSGRGTSSASLTSTGSPASTSSASSFQRPTAPRGAGTAGNRPSAARRNR